MRSPAPDAAPHRTDDIRWKTEGRERPLHLPRDVLLHPAQPERHVQVVAGPGGGQPEPHPAAVERESDRWAGHRPVQPGHRERASAVL